MSKENKSNFELHGREFAGTLIEDDPRSAIGARAIGHATSNNEEGWVPPRDIGYSCFKKQEQQSTKTEIKQDEFSIVTSSKPKAHIEPVVDPSPPIIQELKRADGTDTKIRVPHSGRC